MPHRLCHTLALGIVVVSLSGCGRTVTVVRVEPCPPVAPAASCPDFPPRSQHLREHMVAWKAAERAHAQCRAALGAWLEAAGKCGVQLDPSRRPLRQAPGKQAE